jgi:hypothetical protein
MAEPGGPAAGAASPVRRCTRCGAAVTGTVHVRGGYRVGYYAMHTGRTVEATVRRREDEAPLVYRRLVEPVEVVSCPACFVLPEVQRRWAAFGDEEPPPA